MKYRGLGSWSWSERSLGKVQYQEKFELARQAVALQVDVVGSLAKRLIGIRKPSLTGDEVLSFRMPSTPTVRHVETLVEEVSSEALFRHSLRTYLWAKILAKQDGIVFDDELLYVACLCHDLGLTQHQQRGRGGKACFSHLSAKAARKACKGHWPDERRDKLSEIITMHINIHVPPIHGTEAHLLHEGANLDCTGIRFWEIAKSARTEVLRLQPRDGFKQELRDIFRIECNQFPDGRTAFLHKFLLFGVLVKACPLK